jgi:hypothetical protein
LEAIMIAPHPHDPQPPASSTTLPAAETFAIPLLDAVAIGHGPERLLFDFFVRADEVMRAQGVRLWFSNDFSMLERINAAHADSWYPLWPAFTRTGGAGPDNSYFFLGTQGDEIVATQIGRVYDMPEGLTEACSSLRFMYSDPATQATPDDRCRLVGEAADFGHSIKGKVVQSGGTWFMPDKARGRGFASVFPRISRAFALATHGTDWTVSTVRRSLVERGVARAYGYERILYELTWQAPPSRAGYLRPDPLTLVSLTVEETIADLRRTLDSEKLRLKPPRAAE